MCLRRWLYWRRRLYRYLLVSDLRGIVTLQRNLALLVSSKYWLIASNGQLSGIHFGFLRCREGDGNENANKVL